MRLCSNPETQPYRHEASNRQTVLVAFLTNRKHSELWEDQIC